MLPYLPVTLSVDSYVWPTAFQLPAVATTSHFENVYPFRVVLPSVSVDSMLYCSAVLFSPPFAWYDTV